MHGEPGAQATGAGSPKECWNAQSVALSTSSIMNTANINGAAALHAIDVLTLWNDGGPPERSPQDYKEPLS